MTPASVPQADGYSLPESGDPPWMLINILVPVDRRCEQTIVERIVEDLGRGNGPAISSAGITK